MFNKNTWKPLEIDGSLFNGGAEDLIGIEECTDYEINNLVNAKKVSYISLDSIVITAFHLN